MKSPAYTSIEMIYSARGRENTSDTTNDLIVSGAASFIESFISLGCTSFLHVSKMINSKVFHVSYQK
jgi:hypothetical protein